MNVHGDSYAGGKYGFKPSAIEPLDTEVEAICDALNGLPGIETTSSCCGHGFARFRIYFDAQTTNAMLPILTAIEDFRPRWFVRIDSFDDQDISYVLDGPESSYDEANEIARKLSARGASDAH